MEAYFTKDFRKKSTNNTWQHSVSFAKIKFYLDTCFQSGLTDIGLFGLLVCLLNLLNIFETLWNSLFASRRHFPAMLWCKMPTEGTNRFSINEVV